MTNDQKIEIAKQFVALHKNDDADTWLPSERGYGEKKLLAIYQHLLNGTFGNVRNDEYGFEIEISGFETKTGNPYLFEWEDDEDEGEML